MKHSQIFAAQKADLQQTFQAKIQQELIPEFNAEIEDIERETANLFKSNQALATTRRHARLVWLSHKKWSIINPLKIQFKLDLENIAHELHGEIGADGVVKFPDLSSATMPKGLWIDFKGFHKARSIKEVVDKDQEPVTGPVTFADQPAA